MRTFILLATFCVFAASAVLASADTNHAANTVGLVTTKYTRQYRAPDWGQRMTERPSGRMAARKESSGHASRTKGECGRSGKRGHAQQRGNSASAGSGISGGDGPTGKTGQPNARASKIGRGMINKQKNKQKRKG